MASAALDYRTLEAITDEQIEAELCGRRLSHYVKKAWAHVDPDPLVWGWHMDAICEHLEAVSNGEIENLLINVPPGFSKSLLTSVMWPTWEWGPAKRPQGRWMYASYDQQLSTRDSVKCRRLLESAWFQSRWPLSITTDQNQKTYFENELYGWRLATSVGGHGLGQHPDRIVVDDPQDPRMAASDVQRISVLDWWKGTISSRGVSRGVRKVIIMQRLHEQDLSAHVLKSEGWEHLMLPMRMEAGRRCSTSIGFADMRADGELLDPERFPETVLQPMEKELGPYNVAGQLQQRPSPAGGGYIKKQWFRFWTPPGVNLPPILDDNGQPYTQVERPVFFDHMLQSWDCNKLREAENVRKKMEADPVSGGVWGRSGPDFFLLDRVNEKLDVIETCAKILEVSAKWPQAQKKVIEYAANGPTVIALLRREISGLIPCTPEGDKKHRVLMAGNNDREREARGLSMQVMFHSGNVYVPHPDIPGHGWVHAYIHELCSFPTAPHDDDVDMTSQALMHLQPGAWHFEDRQAKAEEDAKPVTLNPKAQFEKGMHDQIKKVLRGYEKAQKTKNPGMGAVGL